jgi:hypothetical protein
MRKIAVIFVLAFALVTLSPIAPADAYIVSNAQYIACYKKVFPQRGYGAVFLLAVDQCARGLPW